MAHEIVAISKLRVIPLRDWSWLQMALRNKASSLSPAHKSSFYFQIDLKCCLVVYGWLQLCIVLLLYNCYRNVSWALCSLHLWDSWSWFGSLPARCLPLSVRLSAVLESKCVVGPTQACANRDHLHVRHNKSYNISWFVMSYGSQCLCKCSFQY